jgi:hypothetical protein
MRLKIHGNNTDRSSHILCSKKHARRKVSVPLRCNATGSKSLAIFPLLASSKTSSEAQSSRNSMMKKRVEGQFIAFIQPYLPRIPTTITKTNGVMRDTDAFEVDSSMHHKENRVKSSHIIKLQDTDTGYRTHLERARVSLSIMERQLVRDNNEENKRQTHTDKGQEEVS